MNSNNITNPLDIQNILFVSDLPRECIDSDLESFFKNYGCTQVKIIK